MNDKETGQEIEQEPAAEPVTENKRRFWTRKLPLETETCIFILINSFDVFMTWILLSMENFRESKPLKNFVDRAIPSLEASETEFLEYRYSLKPGDYMMDFNIRSQGLASTFNSSQPKRQPKSLPFIVFTYSLYCGYMPFCATVTQISF